MKSTQFYHPGKATMSILFVLAVIVPLLFLVIITFVMTFLHESHLRLVHFTDPFKEQIIVSLIFSIFMFSTLLMYAFIFIFI